MEEPAVERSRIERFLEHLRKHKNDRGMMADLRHGFSSATEYRAWPHIALWCDLTNERSRRIMLTVAAGFAVHGRSVPGRSLGEVLRRIATGDGRGQEGLATFDTRFRRFLACSTVQEVCDQLPGVLRAAERRAEGVDFARLHRDLIYWGEGVKLRWAGDYWGGARDEESAAVEQEAS